MVRTSVPEIRIGRAGTMVLRHCGQRQGHGSHRPRERVARPAFALTVSTMNEDTVRDDICRACGDPLWTGPCDACRVTPGLAASGSFCETCLGGGRTCRSCGSGRY